MRDELQRHSDECRGSRSLTPADRAVAFPEHHKDPQDRLIIATALVHQANLISFDGYFPNDQELKGRLITAAFSKETKAP